ncbi:hypothetical protein U9M48_021898 [Paspalum notatum var. saurae]|uniref:Neprosin PEP catalytic domain-containing protein n=1 Tax=Paspalum notatum var. saurae TaxID=547442 RepID=A0AAQ3TK02_PASNO
MERGSVLVVMLCALLANGIVRDCVASYIGEGKNWTILSPLDIDRPQKSSLSGESASVQAAKDSMSDWQWQYASHTWNTGLGGSYYGAEVTSDVYGFGLRLTQASGSVIAIHSTTGGQTTGIIVGWHVFPSLYQDSNTHFFTYWISGGSHCFNTLCFPGFIRTTGSNIAPGDIIYPSSKIAGRVQYISLRVFKDSASGNWNVHCGFNGPAQSVGYFPKDVIASLSSSTQLNITFGGFIGYNDNDSNVPMGNGNVPPNNAANMGHLQLVDIKGGNHVIDEDLPFMSDKCYQVSPIVKGQFSYGGPNNCA